MINSGELQRVLRFVLDESRLSVVQRIGHSGHYHAVGTILNRFTLEVCAASTPSKQIVNQTQAAVILHVDCIVEHLVVDAHRQSSSGLEVLNPFGG
jgi:hypothetical protein